MNNSPQQGKVCLIERCPQKAHFFSEALSNFYQKTQVSLLPDLSSATAVITAGDLVILDVYRCRQMVGDSLLAQLVGVSATVYILDPEPSVESVRAYLAMGAAGYADREAPIEQLLLGFASAWAGNMDIPRVLVTGLLQVSTPSTRRYGSTKLKRGSHLPSQREMDVLTLIVQGKTTIEMSKLLFISEATIETHRSHLLQRFQVSNTASLVREAIIRIPELVVERSR